MLGLSSTRMRTHHTHGTTPAPCMHVPCTYHACMYVPATPTCICTCHSHLHVCTYHSHLHLHLPLPPAFICTCHPHPHVSPRDVHHLQGGAVTKVWMAWMRRGERPVLWYVVYGTVICCNLLNMCPPRPPWQAA